MVYAEAALQSGANLNTVDKRLQIPFALDPAQGQVGFERPLLRRKSTIMARPLHSLLQPQKAVRISVNPAPDDARAFHVGETAEPAKSKFKGVFRLRCRLQCFRQ